MRKTIFCAALAATVLAVTFSACKKDDSGEVQIFTVNGVSFDMVAVQGGTFTMGCTDSTDYCERDEKPAHQVTLSDYSMGKYEVTQELWRAVMGSTPSYFKGDKLPVETVSWDSCQAFIAKLNTLTGKEFRLPTEAEWEYAARGGSRSRGYKYSGSNSIADVAWFYDNSNNSTHAVGTKTANELGIYDMSGNVWEWCSDWYDNYAAAAQTNPTGAAEGSDHVLRGGSWFNYALYSHVAFRLHYTPDSHNAFLGFRLVLP